MTTNDHYNNIASEHDKRVNYDLGKQIGKCNIFIANEALLHKMYVNVSVGVFFFLMNTGIEQRWVEEETRSMLQRAKQITDGSVK